MTGGVLSYDAAGNVTYDTSTGNSYIYDGEGRVCAVRSEPAPGTYTMTQYIYDAEGTRVAKGTIAIWSYGCNTAQNGFTLTNSYAIGPSNEQLTETDGNGDWIHSNVYGAGMLIATYDIAPTGNPALHFQLEDWLGSRRVQTDIAGNPEETYTSLPFGDGLATIPVSGAPPTADDATEHHFTGKERDTESGNDYFGARYYASTMGRFLTPDWSAKVAPVPYAKLDNPQSLNLYAYVGNSPLSRIDADGHYYCSGGNSNCQLLRDGLGNIKEAIASGNLTNKEQGTLQKVLNFYGPEETKSKNNGVTVTFQNVKGGDAGGTRTADGQTTVSLSLKSVMTNPVYRQNGASADTEAASQIAHEGEHGVQQQDHGMPQNKAQEMAGEEDAYKVQSYVNKGEQDNSAFGLWTVQGGFNPAAVKEYATESTADWCRQQGGCK